VIFSPSPQKNKISEFGVGKIFILLPPNCGPGLRHWVFLKQEACIQGAGGHLSGERVSGGECHIEYESAGQPRPTETHGITLVRFGRRHFILCSI